MASAIAVSTRLWLGGVVQKSRNTVMALALALQVKACALCRPLLIFFDGFAAYIKAFQHAFRSLCPSGQRGRPPLVSWPNIVLAQVVKQYAKLSIVQFFRLKKRYQQQGSAGLVDQRQAGNARKLSPEQMELVRGVFAYNRHLSSKALQDELQIEWGIDIGPRRIDQLRQQFNLPRVTPKSDKKQENVQKYACGYNYKNATIDKYLRELKYLQVSTDFIHCNARFWSRFWKKYDDSDHKLACYYIDGNVKPLWSSKRCRSRCRARSIADELSFDARQSSHFLAKEILGETAIEMNTLIQSTLFLPGRIEHQAGVRKVYINKNEKDLAFIAKLAKALSKLNALKIRHPGGAIYDFKFE